jgi:hypothetical protein
MDYKSDLLKGNLDAVSHSKVSFGAMTLCHGCVILSE